MKTYVYQNNRNENKYVAVRRYNDRHYAVKQFITSPDGKVLNFTGCSIRRVHKGNWSRVSKSAMLSIIEDYTLMFSTAANVHYL